MPDYPGRGSIADIRDRVTSVEPVVLTVVAENVQQNVRIDELTSDLADTAADVGDLNLIFENHLI